MGDPEKSDPFEAKATREIAEATAKAKATLAAVLGKRDDQQKQRQADAKRRRRRNKRNRVKHRSLRSCRLCSDGQ
jgi:3'-phosphoadenosine 5'-phosphosulfate sulfotransferase (PAPS reductase)/FAD synthetase